MNIKTPLLGDDLSYVFIFNSSQKINSFKDIIHSQIEHYHTWGGRSVVHAIAQWLIMLPPLLTDVINAFAFVVLLLLIYAHINIKRPFSISLFIGIFLLVWILEPFAETVLWITGSANYMWGTIIILSFLLIYRLYHNIQKKNGIIKEILQAITMLIAGVISGWTNENIASGMIVMLILFIFYFRGEKWYIPAWIYSGLVGVLTGYIFMIGAPGNEVRAVGTETNLFLIVYRLFRHTQTFLNILGVFNLVYIFLLVNILTKKRSGWKNTVYTSLIYEVGVFVSIYVMIFSPSFPLRAWFGIIILNIISIGILVANIKKCEIRYIKYSLVLLGLFIFTFNFYDVYKDLITVNQIFEERIELISNAKNNGLESVELEPYQTATKYAIEDPLYAEPSLTKYYEINIKYK